MSIPVAVADLPATLAGYPWGYIVTVGPALQAHVLAVPTEYRDGSFHLEGGRSTRANASERPEVTMVFPSPAAGEYSLVVDGTATVHDDRILVRPEHAVLHRPAIAAAE